MIQYENIIKLLLQLGSETEMGPGSWDALVTTSDFNLDLTFSGVKEKSWDRKHKGYLVW